MTSTTAVPTLTMTWHGPFSFEPGAPNTLWVGPISDCCGIYLWTVPVGCGHLVHRVGGTGRPFWQAHHHHLEAYRRGEYPIHRAASLAAGRRDPLHRGLNSDREPRERQQARFINQAPRLQAELRATLSLLAAFLAPMESDCRHRQRIEAALIAGLLKAGPEASALLDTRRVPRARSSAEIPIIVRAQAPANVLGLTPEFEV